MEEPLRSAKYAHLIATPTGPRRYPVPQPDLGGTRFPLLLSTLFAEGLYKINACVYIDKRIRWNDQPTIRRRTPGG